MRRIQGDVKGSEKKQTENKGKVKGPNQRHERRDQKNVTQGNERKQKDKRKLTVKKQEDQTRNETTTRGYQRTTKTKMGGEG